MFSYKKIPKNSLVLYGLAPITILALLIWLNIRPFSLGFLLLFTYWFYKTRCNVCLMIPPELKVRCEKILEQLRVWKKTKPAVFCCITSVCLGAMAIIGHFISDSIVVLIGLMFAAIISTKYNFQLVKKEITVSSIWSSKYFKEFDIEDEFMPEVNEANFIVFENAADTTKTYEVDEADESDEIPSELSLPLDTLPEINDAENSVDDDDEQNDLIPIPKSSCKEDRDVKDAQLVDGMQFKKSYFKQDSSLSTTSTSSSEESLSKGLTFPDHSVIDKQLSKLSSASPQPEIDDKTTALLKTTLTDQTNKLLLSGLMSGIVQGFLGAGSPPDVKKEVLITKRDTMTIETSSDESDFELIDNEDLN